MPSLEITAIFLLIFDGCYEDHFHILTAKHTDAISLIGLVGSMTNGEQLLSNVSHEVAEKYIHGRLDRQTYITKCIISLLPDTVVDNHWS